MSTLYVLRSPGGTIVGASASLHVRAIHEAQHYSRAIGKHTAAALHRALNCRAEPDGAAAGYRFDTVEAPDA